MNLKGVNLKKERTKIQMVLTVLVILSVVRQFFLGNYHNMFLGILTLFLFMVPAVLDQTLGVTIPAGLETVILIFIFSAEILGEINAFYVKIPVWDTILHTTNGFLMAAIGFALIDLFNPTGANVPVHVDIQSVVINGEKWNLGGYLDIGIVDTMKDLMVNFIGAVVFSIIGILYLKHRGKGKLAASLIPQVRDEKEQKQ